VFTEARKCILIYGDANCILFQAYVRDVNRQFAANTVSAIGRCAVRLPAVRSACVEGLLMLAKGVLVGDGASHTKEETDQSSGQGGLKLSAKEKSIQEAGVVAQAVLALRSIVQQNPSEQEQVELDDACSDCNDFDTP
jgi:AP-3 complex subunit beta